MTSSASQASTSHGSNESDIAISAVSVVVPNLEEAMRLYSRLFHWNPWTIYEDRDADRQDDLTEGRPEDFRVRVAVARAGDVDVELTEPVGPSPYQQYLDDHGPGFHHVGFSSSTIDVVERFSARGLTAVGEGVLAGPDGGRRYSVYAETPGVPFRVAAHAGGASPSVGPGPRTVEVRDGSIVDIGAGRPPTGVSIIQVGVVVPDVTDTLRALREVTGWGPWRVHDFDEDLSDRTYRGRDCDFGMGNANLQAGTVNLELLSPTGPGPFSDFLDETGPGLHHIQVRATVPKDTHGYLVENGLDTQFSGRVMFDDGDGLDFYMLEGGGLPHLVEITVGDRARVIDRFDLVSGD